MLHVQNVLLSSATHSEHEALNVDATSKFLSVSKECKVKKFIFISTVGVYGVSSEKSHISLKTPVNPQTPYAKAKYKSELRFILRFGVWGLRIYWSLKTDM